MSKIFDRNPSIYILKKKWKFRIYIRYKIHTKNNKNSNNAIYLIIKIATPIKRQATYVKFTLKVEHAALFKWFNNVSQKETPLNVVDWRKVIVMSRSIRRNNYRVCLTLIDVELQPSGIAIFLSQYCFTSKSKSHDCLPNIELMGWGRSYEKLCLISVALYH